MTLTARKNHYTHTRGQNFCAISLQKQAILGDMWQQWRSINLLILLSLFVADCPWIPTSTVCGTEGRGSESWDRHLSVFWRLVMPSSPPMTAHSANSS